MGLLLDRFGLTKVATMAVGLWSLASFMTGLAGSFSSLLVWRAVLGFAESAALPASGKAYAQLLQSEERSLGTATNQLGLALGSVVSVILAGWMTPRYGWQASFLVAAPLGWLWIPLWIVMYRRAPAATTDVQQKAQVRATGLLSDKRMWALIVANLLTMPLYSLWTNWTT